MIPPAGPRFVSFYRISTDKQGRPGGGRLAPLIATLLPQRQRNDFRVYNLGLRRLPATVFLVSIRASVPAWRASNAD